MIEQVSNSLMVVAFFADTSGQGVTGLTVTVDAYRIVNNAGTPTPTQVLTNAAATAIGGGFYARLIAAADVTVEGEYAAIFKTSSSSVRDKQLPAMWSVNVAGVEHLDADVADVPDAVWDEALAGHATAGSTGEALAAAGAAGGTEINLDALELITIDGFNLVPLFSITGIGSTDAIRVICDGSLHDVYTRFGTTWTKRGSQANNATHSTATLANYIIATGFTLSRFTAYDRSSSVYDSLLNQVAA